VSEAETSPNILIVEARFYEDILDELAKGATQELDRRGARYERLAVPGAFEIPAAIVMSERGAAPRFDGYLALGCVIRGETSHYDYVCGESARKLQDIACQDALAIGYGILTCDNRDQAWVRASVEGKNKGGEVAGACLRMLEVKRRFHAGSR
jgi:6,7-dimethyl-8-ribityllumazine synthase